MSSTARTVATTMATLSTNSTTSTTTSSSSIGGITTTLLIIVLGWIMIELCTKSSIGIWNPRKVIAKYGIPLMHHTMEGSSYPYIGQLINFLQYRPWDLISIWHIRYGPILCIPLLGKFLFSIGSPELCKLVLQSQIQYIKKDIYDTMKHFIVILGTGIVSSDDSHWLQQRKRMSTPLRQHILTMIPRHTLMAIQRLYIQMDPIATDPKSSTTTSSTTKTAIPMSTLLRHLTLQVISGTFLSLSANESDSTFAQMYYPIVDESNARVWHPYRSYCFFLPSWWYYHYNVYQLNQYVSQLIEQRWELIQQEEEEFEQQQQQIQQQAKDSSNKNGNHHSYPKRDLDILDGMLQWYRKEFITTTTTNKQQQPYIRNKLPKHMIQQFRDEMKTFMLAGHETSAAMMTWTLYELMGNGTYMEQLYQESIQVFGQQTHWDHLTDIDLPNMETLHQLVYTEACLKESLRKYSVVPIVTRRTIQDLYLLNQKYKIPKGSSLIINIQAIHHNPQIWKDPMEYQPNRFVPTKTRTIANTTTTTSNTTTTTTKNTDSTTNQEDNENNISNNTIEPFTFLPFIAGPRNCLGQHLALLESKMVIALLIQRYQLSLPPGEQVEALDWTSTNDPRHRYMVPTTTKKELMIHVQRRW